MNKIVDYAVITSSKGIQNLESLIKENIRLGWQPIGGIATMDSALDSDESLSKPILMQAMVLFES
ncbi:MAG: hypothetical protein ABI416_19460 [Ginsengibacter sp.]